MYPLLVLAPLLLTLFCGGEALSGKVLTVRLCGQILRIVFAKAGTPYTAPCGDVAPPLQLLLSPSPRSPNVLMLIVDADVPDAYSSQQNDIMACPAGAEALQRDAEALSTIG